MIKSLQEKQNRKNLKDENYAFLFEEPENDELVCFDCETTGLNPKKADILSIGAVLIRDNKVLTSQKLELFIKPPNVINEASIKVHYLRHVDLMNGLDANQAIMQFLRFIGGRPLVGYYLEFDVAMVNKYAQELLGIKLPNRQIEVSGVYYNKKQSAIPQGNIDLRFDTIMDDLDLPVLGKHDAFNDALMTAMMYIKLQNVKRL